MAGETSGDINQQVDQIVEKATAPQKREIPEIASQINQGMPRSEESVNPLGPTPEPKRKGFSAFVKGLFGMHPDNQNPSTPPETPPPPTNPTK